ncbi:MAG: TonB-dependent receptor [Bacteroidia bacterium]|nr:TonB-dependent receptor [Bacteroidia bacterium]
MHVAAENFEADYDAFEFTDAVNSQVYNQVRFGLTPSFRYNKGELQGRFFYNKNEREFKSDFPSLYEGRNLQTEIVHRHHFSNTVQTLAGLNYQRMAYGQENANTIDTTSIYTFDPYASLLIDLPVGLTVHAGVRLNTHSEYGGKVVYNVNPSYLINRDGDWRVKLGASVSTSYITPSLYQLYSFYGNSALVPEEATNYEAGVTLYGSDAFTFSATWFLRDESQPIDFVSLFDDGGNYIGGQYRNLTAEREVKGIELLATAKVGKLASISANYTHLDTDKPESFYRIPTDKYGVSVNLRPVKSGSVSLRFTHTGDRTIFDFNSFSEITLRHYDLVDLSASYGFLQSRLTVYGSVNNMLDEHFVAVFGYTTRGRNYNAGVRYAFGKS